MRIKKVVKLKESDLQRIIKRVLTEQDHITDMVESTITDKNCIGSATHIDVVEKFDNLTEKMGYSCVGSRNRDNVNDIVLKKSIDCGFTTKRLYIFIVTKDFVNNVGDLNYYGEGIGKGTTTLNEISGLERRVKESCEEKDDCISYEKFKNWFDGNGYEVGQTPTGMSFIKYCGNVKSVINLTTGNGGCVNKVDERQFVSSEDGVMKSGQTVWERGEDADMTLDKILNEIKDAVKYGYNKYKQDIDGCSGLL